MVRPDSVVFNSCSAAGHRSGGVKNRVDFRARHPVKDIPSVPAVPDDPGFPQHSQLLGKIRLAVAEDGFHVADALLSRPQNIQNRESGGVSQQLENHYQLI